MFCKNSCSENFAKFTREYLHWSLFFIKLQASNLLAYNSIKKRESPAQLLSWEFCQIFLKTFLTEYLRVPASVCYLVIHLWTNIVEIYPKIIAATKKMKENTKIHKQNIKGNSQSHNYAPSGTIFGEPKVY